MLVTQLCPTLCNSRDCDPPSSSVHEILQVRILEWVFPSPGDLPNPGIEPRSPALQAGSLLSEPPGKPIQYSVKCKKGNRASLRPLATKQQKKETMEL